MKIPLKYKVPLQGEYQVDCSSCPECGWNSWDKKDASEKYFLSFIGLTDQFVIRECPDCGTKYYYHHRNSNSWITTLKLRDEIKEKQK